MKYVNHTINCIAVLSLLVFSPVTAHAAQAVYSGTITVVSPLVFTGGQSKIVTVTIRSINGSGNVVIEADSWPSGWSVSPKNRNPTINQSTYYYQSFTVTPPSAGGSGTIVWKLYDDDYGIHPSGSRLLATKYQSVSATVPDTTPPSIPSLQTPTNGSTTYDQTPYFNWSDSTDLGSGLSYYEIEVYDGDITWGDISTTTTSSNYTPSSNIPYDTIYWKVRAVDNAGNPSNWSSVRSLYLVEAPDITPPSNPNSFSGSPSRNTWSTDNTVYVSWSGASDNKGLKRYYYRWSTSSSSSVSSSDSYTTTSSGSGSKTSAALSDGSSWYFHIRYVDTSNNLASSTAHYGPFKIDTADPGVPSLQTPTNGSTTYDQTPYFNWSDSTDSSSGISHYEIEVYDGDITWGDISTTTTSSNYTPSSNIPHDEIHWRVLAVDNAGNKSNWTSVWSFYLQEATINSAYWWMPLDVSRDDDVTMCAEVQNIPVGEECTFRIYEDDGVWPLDDPEGGTVTGSVYTTEGKTYVKATWNAVWQDDQWGDPEYYFKVTYGSVSLYSSQSATKEVIVRNDRQQPSMIHDDFYYSNGGEATQQETLTDNRIPIILVHGASGDRKDDSLNYWYGWANGDMAPSKAQLGRFNQNDMKNKFRVYRYVYDSRRSIRDNGEEFAAFVNQFYLTNQTFGERQVIIMAHSMGGLVTRYALNTNSTFRDKVHRVITLATPHLGSPWSNPSWVRLPRLPDDPERREDIFVALFYNSNFGGTQGDFDLAWYNTNDIPLAARLGEWYYQRVADVGYFSEDLLDGSLTNPFCGSNSMTSVIGDNRIIAYGGYFSSLIVGVGQNWPEPVADEVISHGISDHEGLNILREPLKDMYYDGENLIGDNDGLVPITSALLGNGHTNAEKINLTQAYNEEADHSSYLDVATTMDYVVMRLMTMSKVTISPQTAINAGARWRISGEAWQKSGVSLNALKPGQYTVEFKDVAGWSKPQNYIITVNENETTTVSGTPATYEEENYDCTPGETETCGSDEGQCVSGTKTCDIIGQWGVCENEIGPESEICDGFDNDCDSEVDEGCGCSEGETRNCGTTDVGQCEFGTQTCGADGLWGGCQGDIGPEAEVCDGLDNDCDGSLLDDAEMCGGNCDESADCGDSNFCNGVEICLNGTCSPGTSPCVDGQSCDEGNDQCYTSCGVDFVSPESMTFSSSGGTSTFWAHLTSYPCELVTTPDSLWINLQIEFTSEFSPVLYFYVHVTADHNNGEAREGTVTIAGDDYIVSQDAAVFCEVDSDCAEGEMCNSNSGFCNLVPKGVIGTGDPDEGVCNSKSYTDLGNGIVRDNVTGLGWVQDGNLMASRDPGFDLDDTLGDGKVIWQHALDYVDLLNAESYLGYNDWRLPTVEELSTLVDAGRFNPAIEPAFSAMGDKYWSSTVLCFFTPVKWLVHFYDGFVDGSLNDKSYVRAVRGGPYGLFGNFADNEDGTITDKSTGLIWQHCGYGQTWDGSGCTGSEGAQSWTEALDYVDDLNDSSYFGYSDWHLPTRNELQSLLDYSLDSPATTFPNMASSYWSSTTNANSTDDAWYVTFDSGRVLSGVKSSNFDVRAARGGQCWTDVVDCLADSNCADGNVCEWGLCVECDDNFDCDDDVSCNGEETCDVGMCVSGISTCEAGEYCNEISDLCVDCLYDADCDDGNFCNGVEICDVGSCFAGSTPCEVDQQCDEDYDDCVECLDSSHCEDDSLYCTGGPICEEGLCGFEDGPCEVESLVCDEVADLCVECLYDGHCSTGYECFNGVCAPAGFMLIDKCKVKAGKNGKGDSIQFSGLMDVTTADFMEADNVIVTIDADDIPDLNATTYMFPITYLKKGKYKSPKDKTIPQTSLKIDTVKGKMKFKVKGADLIGLSCPITVKVQIGGYVAEIELNENIVNGTKKPCPPELMSGS